MSRSHHPLSWRTSPWRFFAAALVSVLAIAGAERFAAQLLAPGGAGWIWAPGDYRQGTPIAFYAARDLELSRTGAARLAIVADEVYVLYVNGRRLGSGAYRPAAPVDEYEIGDFLEVGTNRILIELRSGRGAGGLLAELELDGEGDGDGRVVVTDADWRIFRRYDPALLGGWSPLDGGEAPKVWQRAPTGRWRPGAARARRPTAFASALPPARRRPLRVRQPNRFSWHELDWQRRRLPALGPHQLYDWGEEVEGFLSFDLTSDEGQPGLLYFGSEPPDPRRQPPDEILLPIPGRRYWEDAHSRRFRYALVVGAEPYSRMEVEQPEPGTARAPEALANQNGGVFGLQPPRAYSHAEEAVWERLGAQGGVTGSKVSTSSSTPAAKR